MIHDTTLTPTKIMKLSPDDRLSYIRQQCGYQQYNEDLQVTGEYLPVVMPAEIFPVHLHLTEDELSLILGILDQKKTHAQSMIDKCYDFPTINGPNQRTIEKHRDVIDLIDSLTGKIVDQ